MEKIYDVFGQELKIGDIVSASENISTSMHRQVPFCIVGFKEQKHGVITLLVHLLRKYPNYSYAGIYDGCEGIEWLIPKDKSNPTKRKPSKLVKINIKLKEEV